MKRKSLFNKTGLGACRYLIFPLALALTAATASAGTIKTGDQPSDTIQTFDAFAADPDGCFIGKFSGHGIFLPNVDASFNVNFGDATVTDDGFKYRFTPTPGSFVEDLTTGTATLMGSLISTNPMHPGYGFNVTLVLSMRTNASPPFISGELMPSCYVSGGGTVDPATWHYYMKWDFAVLVGTGKYAGAQLTLTQFMHNIQVGAGATGKNVQPGVGGWFMWHVDAQPTNPSFVLRNSADTGVYGDFDFNITAPACSGTIGDFVWNDLNGNGCQDSGEPGIQGVQVELFAGCPASGSALQSTTTDANGHYLFTGLCGGNYTVRFHTPGGFTHTVSGSACGGTPGDPHNPNDSNCLCTGTVDCDVCVILPTGGSDLTVDCGYIPPPCPGTIGDFVWNDLNGNGCQDAGEPGIQGVQVELFAGCPAGGSALQTATTDANGHYLFTGLCAGNYSVRFHTPGGFTHTVSGSACGGTPGDPHNPNDSNCQCTGTVDCDVCVILPTGGSDLTVDCGYIVVPTPLPCPAGLFLGGKTTGGSLPGDISLAFDQFPAPNDNSYGLNAIGWGGAGKHKFSDLTGSDKAGFQILRPNGTVAVSFNVDYISSSTLGAPPSSYKSLGPFGGDGSIVTNSTPALTSDGTTIQWDTSFARDLNGPQSPFGTYSSPTYFTGGVQTIGTSGTNSASLLTDSPPVNCSLATDPSTCITTYGTPKGDQYPLAVPNPWNASYNNAEYAVVPIGSSTFENAIARHVDGWNFHDTYFVTFKQSYLTAIGFDFNNFAIANYNPATNTFTCASGKWCVAPNPTVLHNSPAKACPIPATVVVTAKALSSKNVKITFQNNTTTGQVLTGLSITWPQATNGNLTTIKLGGTTVYSTSTGGGSLTTSSLLGTTAQRTINAGGHQDLTFTFLNNVDTNASHYTGSVTFNPFGNVTTLP